jgi:hypothetical protein
MNSYQVSPNNAQDERDGPSIDIDKLSRLSEEQIVRFAGITSQRRRTTTPSPHHDPQQGSTREHTLIDITLSDFSDSDDDGHVATHDIVRLENSVTNSSSSNSPFITDSAASPDGIIHMQRVHEPDYGDYELDDDIVPDLVPDSAETDTTQQPSVPVSHDLAKTHASNQQFTHDELCGNTISIVIGVCGGKGLVEQVRAVSSFHLPGVKYKIEKVGPWGMADVMISADSDELPTERFPPYLWLVLVNGDIPSHETTRYIDISTGLDMDTELPMHLTATVQRTILVAKFNNMVRGALHPHLDAKTLQDVREIYDTFQCIDQISTLYCKDCKEDNIGECSHKQILGAKLDVAGLYNSTIEIVKFIETCEIERKITRGHVLVKEVERAMPRLRKYLGTRMDFPEAILQRTFYDDDVPPTPQLTRDTFTPPTSLSALPRSTVSTYESLHGDDREEASDNDDWQMEFLELYAARWKKGELSSKRLDDFLERFGTRGPDVTMLLIIIESATGGADVTNASLNDQYHYFTRMLTLLRCSISKFHSFMSSRPLLINLINTLEVKKDNVLLQFMRKGEGLIDPSTNITVELEERVLAKMSIS